MRSTTTLVLAAHGAGDDSASNSFVRQLANQVEAFTGVRTLAAFHLGAPSYENALASSNGKNIVVIPILMASGYFADTVLRSRTAAEDQPGSRSIRQWPPIGTWPEVQEGFASMITNHLESHRMTPALPRLIVVGHGTSRHPNSRDSTDAVARAIENTGAARASVAFIDQEPFLSDQLSSTKDTAVHVAPYLLGGGDHAQVDIQVAARDHERTTGAVVSITPAASDLGSLSRMIADRVARQIGPLTVRLATRTSPLAQVQCGLVARVLARAGRSVEPICVDTTGDIAIHTPIDELPGEAPFTDDLQRMLEDDRADLATHSCKDLPLALDPRFPIVAYLPRHDASEALVAQNGLSLQQLPVGARVGVSSLRRARQVLTLRPDLEIIPIRGPVDLRVEQVLAGRFDATVLAVAGLERLGLAHRITQRFSHRDLMPEPGQGAIAIQGRSTDEHPWAESIDHPPTRRAVEAELAFARMIHKADTPNLIAAAHATASASGCIRITGRLIGPAGAPFCDATASGTQPRSTGARLARRLLGAQVASTGAAP